MRRRGGFVKGEEGNGRGKERAGERGKERGGEREEGREGRREDGEGRNEGSLVLFSSNLIAIHHVAATILSDEHDT